MHQISQRRYSSRRTHIHHEAVHLFIDIWKHSHICHPIKPRSVNSSSHLLALPMGEGTTCLPLVGHNNPNVPHEPVFEALRRRCRRRCPYEYETSRDGRKASRMSSSRLWYVEEHKSNAKVIPECVRHFKYVIEAISHSSLLFEFLKEYCSRHSSRCKPQKPCREPRRHNLISNRFDASPHTRLITDIKSLGCPRRGERPRTPGS